MPDDDAVAAEWVVCQCDHHTRIKRQVRLATTIVWRAVTIRSTPRWIGNRSELRRAVRLFKAEGDRPGMTADLPRHGSTTPRLPVKRSPVRCSHNRRSGRTEHSARGCRRRSRASAPRLATVRRRTTPPSSTDSAPWPAGRRENCWIVRSELAATAARIVAPERRRSARRPPTFQARTARIRRRLRTTARIDTETAFDGRNPGQHRPGQAAR